LLTGNLSSLERRLLPYPSPIVDHNEQQRKFRELYKQQKIKTSYSEPPLVQELGVIADIITPT
jgi:deoxyribodipyrimidine photo-lyase